jgi:CheY-like chemotaxis protein
MSPTRLSHLTIVVVEDHDDARRYLGYFLDCLGAKVVLTRNAFEGLDAIKNNHPNIVLSDIAMPGMDGFELLREIRRSFWRSARAAKSPAQSGLRISS